MHFNSAIWNNALWSIRTNLARIDGEPGNDSPLAQAFDRVVYAALTTRLGPTAGFLDARAAVEQVTVDSQLDPVVLRVGDLLVRALERYPQIELELHQVLSSDALMRVGEQSLDASFYFGALPTAGLRSIPLRDICYRVALPLAWGDELVGASWDTLADRSWIVAPEPSSHRQLVTELFDGRAQPHRIIEADNESLIVNLVESGVAASLIRAEVVAPIADARRAAIWPGACVTTQLWLVHGPDRDGDPLLAALRDVLLDVWANTPEPEAQPS